jgi:hypothetical protein
VDFLNHRVGGMVFYPCFPPFSFTVNSRICKRLREFEEIKSEGKAVEVTVNSMEENSEEFCLDFVQEFCLWKHGWYQK